jgi:zinc transport system substrate-binding protein
MECEVTGKGLIRIVLCFAVVLVIALYRGVPLCSESLGDANDRIRAFVSILPQVYFVERIGGKRVDVSCMVGPGHSPATYEPMPRQMAELSKATLYFRIGVPFENVWIDRISKSSPDMKVIDTRRGIPLMPMRAHDHAGYRADPHDRGLKDPHVWLSLRLASTLAQNIYKAFVSEDPLHQSFYQANLQSLRRDLDELDAEIVEIMKNAKTRKFMVFHPAWGYFAHDYGLEQVPIETEGKDPTAKGLAAVIDKARKEGIKVIFVQKQFSEKSAETVASAIGGKVIQIDPLAGDYLDNMRKIAQTFAEVLQ